MDWLAIAGLLLGGAGLGNFVTNWIESRQEHKKWLREQKVAAYSTLLSSAYQILQSTHGINSSETDKRKLIEDFGKERWGDYERRCSEQHIDLAGLDAHEKSKYNQFNDELNLINADTHEELGRLSEAVEAFRSCVGHIHLFSSPDVFEAMSDLLGAVDLKVPTHDGDETAQPKDVVEPFGRLMQAGRKDLGTGQWK